MVYWKIKGQKSEFLGLCLGRARMIMCQMRMSRTVIVGKYWCICHILEMKYFKICAVDQSLVAQWQRTGLLIQGLRVQVSPGEIVFAERCNQIVSLHGLFYKRSNYFYMFGNIDFLFKYNIILLSDILYCLFLELATTSNLAGNYQSIIYHFNYM